MRKPDASRTSQCFKGVISILTLESITLSALLFMQISDLTVKIVKLYSGLKAFAGFTSLIPLAILELGFVVAIGSHYRWHNRHGNIWGAFFRANSILCLLFLLLEFSRFLIYRPILVSRNLPFYSIWSPLNYVNALGGLLFGAGFAVLALWRFRAKS